MWAWHRLIYLALIYDINWNLCLTAFKLGHVLVVRPSAFLPPLSRRINLNRRQRQISLAVATLYLNLPDPCLIVTTPQLLVLKLIGNSWNALMIFRSIRILNQVLLKHFKMVAQRFLSFDFSILSWVESLQICLRKCLWFQLVFHVDGLLDILVRRLMVVGAG